MLVCLVSLALEKIDDILELSSVQLGTLFLSVWLFWKISSELVWEMNSPHICAVSLMRLSLELTSGSLYLITEFSSPFQCSFDFQWSAPRRPKGSVYLLCSCALCFSLLGTYKSGTSSVVSGLFKLCTSAEKAQSCYSLGRSFRDVSTCPLTLWIALTFARWQNFLSMRLLWI